MTKKTDENQPIMTQIRAMEKGNKLRFPMKYVLYLRSNISTYSLQLGRRYCTHVDRELNCVEVTRLK